MAINQQLAKKLNLSSSTIEQIEKLHEYRDDLESKRAHGEISKHEFDKFWRENELKLQSLWGFEQDSKKHMFWESALCTCPYHDNVERWGTGYAIINLECPLHGRQEYTKQ